MIFKIDLFRGTTSLYLAKFDIVRTVAPMVGTSKMAGTSGFLLSVTAYWFRRSGFRAFQNLSILV